MPSLETIRYVADSIPAYFTTGRGLDGDNFWTLFRDPTRQLSGFEHLAFRET